MISSVVTHPVWDALIHPFLSTAPYAEAIPIPADQPIMKIKDLEEVTIPTVEIKANTKNTTTTKANTFSNKSTTDDLLSHLSGGSLGPL